MNFILKIERIIGESVPDKNETTIIDANSMISLGLYTEACEATGQPFGESATKVLEVLQKNVKITNNSLEKSILKQGFNLMQYLRKRKNWEIYFSLFAKSELYRTLSERKFDEILTKSGVPFRIRKNKFARTEIIFDYYKEVTLRHKNVEKHLEDMGIELIMPETIIELSKETLDYIYAVSSTISLDVFDSYIYSLSLRMSCSELYTNDREFFVIVNKIHKPDRAEWKKISNILREKILKLPPYKDIKQEDLPLGMFPKGKNK